MSVLSFVHLRVRSSYSLLESTVFIDDLVKKCVQESFSAVALTDGGNLFGSLEFSVSASAKKIQPIIGEIFGFDAELTDDKVLDEILVLAKNQVGYNNLLKLSSEYYTLSNGKERCISFAQLKNYAEGLIVLTSWDKGTVGRLILERRFDQAENFLLKLNQVFDNHLYIELIRCDEDKQKQCVLEEHLIEFGLKHNIPFVATNDVYFLTQDMHEAHDALLCIADGKYIFDDIRRKVSAEHYLKSAAQMSELFSDIPEAVLNTVKISQRCSVKAEVRPVEFPHYDVKFGKDAEEELVILTKKGLEEHLKSVTDDHAAYWDRLKYELDVIIQMRFPSYLLVVSDVIRWSKSNNIPVGPGRGSGAGSIVSWCLGITDVDPIKYGLFFERFLNPERVSLPDLDIDFCQFKRDRVIEYVRTKYGNDKVAHIITFGKLQARAVIRDVGRVLQMPYGKVDAIAKMIPFNAVNPVTLSQAIELEDNLKQIFKNDPEVTKLIGISLKLEGLHRHASMHAAGIVIGARPLDEVVPLYKDPDSNISVIQYSMKYADLSGLIKFDFLGLKTLTVIANCEDFIRVHNPEFNINTIPLDDQKTFDLLSLGKSVCVFQFEKASVRDALSRVKPDSIEDIIALGALIRPGPMDNIPTYISCKHGITKPNYIHPRLQLVLEKTFGVVIYQEQVMEIAKILAGYTLGAADLLRRAMGKKIKEEMDQQREIFVNGSIANGLSKEEAVNIFELVAKFAGYGFNRAHAVAYGVISYQTAYLKANYPAEFLVAFMNTEIDDTDKLAMLMQEAKEMGIKVLGPDINLSEALFEVVVDSNIPAIRYALGALKNVSIALMKEVCEERKTNGVYHSVQNFFVRMGERMNKRQAEYLIKAGVFDQISSNRKQIFDSIDVLVNVTTRKQEDHNQMTLFSSISGQKPTEKQLCKVDDWGYTDRLDMEYGAFGFYFSEHPLAIYNTRFNAGKIYHAQSIKDSIGDGSNIVVKIAAIPVSVKIKSSPKGRYMLLVLSTVTGMIESMLFDDKLLELHRDDIYQKKPMIFSVNIRKSGEFERITIQDVMLLDRFLSKNKSDVEVVLQNNDVLPLLKKLIVEQQDARLAPNKVRLELVCEGKKVQIILPEHYSYDISCKLDAYDDKLVVKECLK